jgi:sialic acid synthase SpsE
MIGNKTIGDGFPVFIVSELGVTHEGDIDLAKSFIKAAADAGVDAIKFELIFPDTLIADKEMIYESYTAKGVFRVNYYEFLKSIEFDESDYKELKRFADKCGVLFFATAFDFRGVDLLKELNACAIKISSGELTHKPLIKYAASQGLPLFLDTGGAFVYEIEEAVITAKMEGCEDIIVMHNPTGYPAPPEKTYLRMIPTLKQVLQTPVGLSCHTPGYDVVIAAIALGANVIEKPICRDTTMHYDEAVFSVPVNDIKNFVEKIRFIEKALGEPVRKIEKEELEMRKKYRQSIIAKKNIKKGEQLTEENISFARPNKGIEAKYYDLVIGKTAKRDIMKGEFITWDDIC